MINPPSFHEVVEAIKKLKNHKAPGPDAIPSEFLKYAGEDVIKVIHHFMLSVWETEAFPQE